MNSQKKTVLLYSIFGLTWMVQVPCAVHNGTAVGSLRDRQDLEGLELDECEVQST